MYYGNLQTLILKSKSSRKYFLSLPVNIQMELHKQNQYIHSAAELHLSADLTAKTLVYAKNGKWIQGTSE